MNKKYLAPQVEVANIGTQSIICASGGDPELKIFGGNTNQQW